MSATNAAIGYGFALQKCATSGGSYVAIGEILDLKPGKTTVEKVTVQRNDSPDLYSEKIPGWKDAGDWEIKLVYTATQRAALDALIGVPYFWKFLRPNGTTTNAFAGFISELGDEVPLKDKMTIDIKITVNGANTFTS